MSTSNERLPDPPLGGVILFSLMSARTDGRQVRRKINKGIEQLASALQAAGLAVLHVPMAPAKRVRGSLQSSNRSLEKSVRSAVERLSTQCGANGHRIALVAEGAAADRAVLGARAAWQVRSFVFLSGRLGQQSKELLVEWQKNPILCLVSSEDRTALRDMTDVYFTSKHPDTDIRVFEGLGRGAGLITSWAEQFPQRVTLERTVAEWLGRELSLVGRAREVTFLTEDGWKIFANLIMPDFGEEKAPGVILLHSGRSDRYVFTDLERLLVRAGFAVLNMDWRGRGKSINKGRYFDLTKEERANGKLDARAAIDFLSAQTGVDSERIGLVGIIHGAEHAVRGSIGDSRVKALALLTGYVPIAEEERTYLTSGKVHVMYVTGKAHKHVTETMRALYEATADKLVRLLVFEGGAIGYQLFELDEKFEPAIVEWLQESLAARKR
jgi:dienelactone hydrolase